MLCERRQVRVSATLSVHCRRPVILTAVSAAVSRASEVSIVIDVLTTSGGSAGSRQAAPVSLDVYVSFTLLWWRDSLVVSVLD